MSQFLETLKERFADAQRRLQTAQVRLQQAQTEHNAVMQEFASWQNAISVETRREQAEETQKQLQEQLKRSTHTTVTPVIQSPALNPPSNILPIAGSASTESEVNKTDLIRNVLKQYPNGITPAEVWKQVHDQVGRNYVYSVLKRLKDKKQASERRGKYFLLQTVPKSEDDKEGDAVVH